MANGFTYSREKSRSESGRVAGAHSLSRAWTMSYRRLYRRGAARRFVTRRRDGNTRLSRAFCPRASVCVCVCAGPHTYMHTRTTQPSCPFVVVSFLAVARYLIFASSPLCRGENRRKLNAHDNKGLVCTYIHAVRLYCLAYRAMLTWQHIYYTHTNATWHFYGRFYAFSRCTHRALKYHAEKEFCTIAIAYLMWKQSNFITMYNQVFNIITKPV